MKIYLAGPFFNDQERQIIEKVRDILRSGGHEVFVPMEHFIPDGETLPNAVWGKKVFDMDVEAINNCDIVYAVYHGHYSDSGTAWEIGYAYAKSIPVVLLHTDQKNISSVMPVNSAVSNIFLDGEDISGTMLRESIYGNCSELVEQK